MGNLVKSMLPLYSVVVLGCAPASEFDSFVVSTHTSNIVDGREIPKGAGDVGKCGTPGVSGGGGSNIEFVFVPGESPGLVQVTDPLGCNFVAEYDKVNRLLTAVDTPCFSYRKNSLYELYGDMDVTVYDFELDVATGNYGMVTKVVVEADTPYARENCAVASGVLDHFAPVVANEIAVVVKYQGENGASVVEETDIGAACGEGNFIYRNHFYGRSEIRTPDKLQSEVYEWATGCTMLMHREDLESKVWRAKKGTKCTFEGKHNATTLGVIERTYDEYAIDLDEGTVNFDFVQIHETIAGPRQVCISASAAVIPEEMPYTY